MVQDNRPPNYQVLVGLLAAVGGSLLLGAKNRALASTNAELDRALINEQEERARADVRSTLALDAFKKQIFDANTLLASLPGTQGLRKQNVELAIKGLQQSCP